MAKEDHKTHIWILAVHVIVALAILVTYMDIKKEIKQIRNVDLEELRTQLLQEL